MPLICPTAPAKYFSHAGWTENSDLPVGQIEAGPFVNARSDSDGSSPSPGRELDILDKQADEKHSAANKLRSGCKTKRNHANKNNKGFEMSDATRDLFDRWSGFGMRLNTT